MPSKYIRRQIDKLLDLINHSSKILITTHSNADGDAIGSCVALGLILEKYGKTVNILTPDEYPKFLKWTKGERLIIIFKGNENLCRSIARDADLIFAVDYNDPERLKNAAEVLSLPGKPKILIDHHPHPKNFADVMISDTSRGSSAEIIYYLILQMGLIDYMDLEIAEAIFAGIMTDTGCFSYSCSYPEVFQVVAELMKFGIEKDAIYSRIYDNFSENRLKLMGYCLHEKMTILKPFNTAIICLTRKELKKFSHETGDTEGFVNLPFSIKGIKLTALFIEKEDHVKISFRSRNNLPVNDFSAKYFRGGGHLNAAGGEWDLPLEAAVERFIKLLDNFKELYQ